MNTKRLVFTSLVISGLVFVGCATNNTTLDQNWGRSVETARYIQTLNPDAGQNLETVEGMDGESAINTFDTYRKSFKGEEKSSDYDIKLTGIGMNN